MNYLDLTTRNGEPTARDKELVNHLFDGLAAIFPAWKAAFNGPESVRTAKRVWLMAFRDAGINSFDQVRQGLLRASREGKPFLPSVGQFIAWCYPDPADFGLPTVADAWNQVVHERAHYTHGAVLAARNDVRCDVYNWRQMQADRALKLFEPIYLEYIARVVGGEEFPMPVMIEDRQGRPVTREEYRAIARKHFKALRAALK